MTENKRYYRDFNGDYGTIIRDRITNEEVFELCKLEEENQRLKKMNKELIEIIQGISKDTARTITELWNSDV